MLAQIKPVKFANIEFVTDSTKRTRKSCTDPAQIEPVEPVESVKPVEHVEPVKPVKPVEPVEFVIAHQNRDRKACTDWTARIHYLSPSLNPSSSSFAICLTERGSDILRWLFCILKSVEWPAAAGRFGGAVLVYVEHCFIGWVLAACCCWTLDSPVMLTSWYGVTSMYIGNAMGFFGKLDGVIVFAVPIPADNVESSGRAVKVSNNTVNVLLTWRSVFFRVLWNLLLCLYLLALHWLSSRCGVVRWCSACNRADTDGIPYHVEINFEKLRPYRNYLLWRNTAGSEIGIISRLQTFVDSCRQRQILRQYGRRSLVSQGISFNAYTSR